MKILTVALLLHLGTSFARAADPGAPAEASRPKVLGLDFARPERMESNARIWFSLNQSFGEVSRRIGAQGADRNAFGRVSQFVALAYLNLAIGHYTHELGHNVHSRGYRLDLGDWSSMPWPKWIHGDCEPAYCGSAYGDLAARDRRAQGIAGGLNAEEYDAYFLHRHSTSGMSFDEGMALVFRKMSAATYEVYGGKSLDGDPNQYRDGLRRKGIALSGRAFVRQALLSDVLSVRLFEGAWGAWRYLHDGTREFHGLSFHVGDWEVRPPLVSFYMTPDGVFYDSTVLATRGRGVWELHVGLDADGLGEGRVDRLRLGAERGVSFRAFRDHRGEVGAFGYISLRRSSFSAKGCHVGARTRVPLASHLDLTARGEYSSGDVVENVAKWSPEGFRLTVGAGWRF